MTDEPTTIKSLGQHWLSDVGILEYICEEAKLLPTETVLEIGPGTGNLTQILVKHAKQVVAVEFDEALANQLSNRVKAPNLEVVQSDILQYDLNRLEPDYKVVANIPYYLTSKLIRMLSETHNPPLTAVLLIQKEVAQRVSAQPGNMSLLSVSAQYYWHVGLGDIVPAKYFTPPPKVDSQVVVLDRRLEPIFPDIDAKRYFQLVKAGFSARRKTLLNSLAGGLRLDKTQVETILGSANIDPNARPQTLSLENWRDLYHVVKAQNLI